MISSFPPERVQSRTLLVYLGLLAIIALAAGVVWLGQLKHSVQAAPAGPYPSAIAPETLLHLLLALLAVLLTCSVMAGICRYLQQPPVVGEIVAGICLGPSFLGQVAPGLQQLVLPAEVMPFIGVLSQVGVILFMFLVGLELDVGVMRQHGRSTLAISHASIVVPFVFGSPLAFWLYPSLAGPSASFLAFALFLSVSLSVTAFPVLARVLTDRGMQRSPVGHLALTCAAIDDVTAWCLLAFVVGAAESNAWDAVRTCLATGLYVGLIVAIRPVVTRWARASDRRGELSVRAVALTLLGLLASALITEAIGVHAIFGGFLLGAALPHDTRFAHELRRRLHDLVVVLLLPAFFAFTGMRMQLALVSGWHDWLVCLVIVLAACAGKFGGSYVAARLVGVERREAAAIGILMNTRGLMELIVLNLGLDLGVISPTLFAMMIVMALATTFATSPLLRLVQGSWAGQVERTIPLVPRRQRV